MILGISWHVQETLCVKSTIQTRESSLPLKRTGMQYTWRHTWGWKGWYWTLDLCLGSSIFPCMQGCLNVGYISIYSSREFALASFPRHPRCDVTDSVHILMLVGKVYYLTTPSKLGRAVWIFLTNYLTIYGYDLDRGIYNTIMQKKLKISHFCG